LPVLGSNFDTGAFAQYLTISKRGWALAQLSTILAKYFQLILGSNLTWGREGKEEDLGRN